jgi:eukaryotic-like serine/threonine-protein kinase
MPKTSAARGERPQRIGIYEVIKRIGAGGMGTVYLAKDTDLGRLVALKVLPTEMAAKPEMISRFRQEAQHAAKLRHENIVTLYGCGESKGTHYLAMEYVEGCNLHEYIDEKGKVAPEDARILMVQAAKALVSAHEHNIVHRDIKPSNFLLAVTNGRQVVKLTDFGLARTVDDFDGKVTRTGTTVGTVDYISPEQARSSRAADIRSDIYSLGCTLYHMLAGQPPFPGGDFTERLLKHVEAKPPDILQFNPQTPPALVQILEKMLAKKPEARYQTPEDLLQDLTNPPKVQAISAREALELLAEASGERGRQPPRPSSTQATRRQLKATIVPVASEPTPAVTDIKLHYRKKKNERRKRPEKGDQDAELPASPLVLEGLGPWLAVIGGVTAVALIAMAILFKWGGKTNHPRPEDAQMSTPAGEKTPEKLESSGQAKNTVADLKENLKARRDGEDPETSRAALGAMKAAKEMPQIAVPGEKIRNEMANLFSTPPRSDGSPLTSPIESGTAKTGVPQPPSGDRTVIGQPSVANQSTGSGTPGARPAPSAKEEPRVFKVMRGVKEKEKGTYGTIGAALAAARFAKTPAVIEIKDNGPFFESGLEIKDQSLVLRGADGFRPLIALSNENLGAGERFLLAVQYGTLVLEHLDLVLKCAETQADTQLGLIRLGEGNLLLEDCVLSLAGRARTGVAAIRLDGSPTGTGQSRCWLRRCFVRGADMTGLDVRGPGCSVTLDGCLLVGHERPLIAIRGQNASKPSDLKIAHSTLVNGQVLCQIDAASVREADAPIHFVLWDSFLARSGSMESEPMLRLGASAAVSSLHWRAVNCLYAGWQSLLQYSNGSAAATDLTQWHALLHQEGGDKALPFSWPAYLPPETERIPTAPFRTAGTATAFRDSAGSGVVGCPIQDLPPVRSNWLNFTFDRTPIPAFDIQAPDRAPPIATTSDGRYHGGRLDATRTDLGEHLQKLQDAGQLASRVVVHLTGRGTAQVTPFRLKDVQLVLYADPAADSVTLSPKSGSTADALMSFVNGGCELIGVRFALPAADKGSDVGAFVKTKNANLRVIGCRMKSVSAKNSIRTLLAFEGSGNSAIERASDCVLTDSILETSGWILKMSGNGSRLRVQNSLLLAGEDAIVWEPGTLSGPLNLRCVLDRDTIAARRAAMRCQDMTAGVLPLDPLPVQSRACVFLNPFGELPNRAGLLAFEDRALAHGLVSWQPDGNAYDKHMGYAMSQCEREREFPLPAEACAQICGPLADRRGITFDGAIRDFKLGQPALDGLSLPAAVRAKIKGTPPGADFEQLGIGKR